MKPAIFQYCLSQETRAFRYLFYHTGSYSNSFGTCAKVYVQIKRDFEHVRQLTLNVLQDLVKPQHHSINSVVVGAPIVRHYVSCHMKSAIAIDKRTGTCDRRC
jgi:hypothetical protein